MFLDVLKSLELPLFDFSGIGAGATHLGGCNKQNMQLYVIANQQQNFDSTLQN